VPALPILGLRAPLKIQYKPQTNVRQMLATPYDNKNRIFRGTIEKQAK